MTVDQTSRDSGTSATLPASSSAPPTSGGPGGFKPGAVLADRYELAFAIGSGAHGVVWKAHDRHVDEFVALKVLRDVREDDLLLMRRELSAARSVSHPGVVRMHDLVHVQGAWALSMGFVEGESLERVIERGGLTKQRLFQIALQLAEALAAAHAADVTHRDLKPPNILVRKDGRPVITDFGISRVTRRDSVSPAAGSGEDPAGGSRPAIRLTIEGAIIGTPLYMAPEQLEGRVDITPSVDLYAWALIVHELATKHVPHEAETFQAVKERRLAEPIVPLDETLASSRLRAAVALCLARDPTMRPTDGAALVQLLVPSVSAPVSLKRPSRARRVGLAALGFAAIAVVGVVGTSRVLRPMASVPAPDAEASLAPLGAPSFHNARKLTFSVGCDEYPSFSPDGTRVLFDKSDGPRSHVHELELATGHDKRLTTSPRWDFSAAYVPDGRIVFLRYGDTRASMLLDSSTGNVRELARGSVRPMVAPDGRSAWVGEQSAPTRVDLDTGAVLERMTPPTGMQAMRIGTFANGDHIALFRTGDGDASLVARYDGSWTELRKGRFFDSLSFSTDRTTAFLFEEHGDVNRTVLAIRPGAEVIEAHTVAHADASIANDRALWSTCGGSRDWVVFEGAQTRQRLPQYGAGTRDAVSLRDGRNMLVSLLDGAEHKLWLVGASGPPRLISLPAVPEELHAAGDQVLVATSGGLFRVDPTVEPPATTQLTTDRADVAPTLGHGGDVVFSRQVAAGASRLMRWPARGGEAVAFGPPGARAPAASPTADTVVFLDQQGALFIWSAGASAPFGVDLPPGPYERVAFSPDGSRVAVIRTSYEALELDAASGRILSRRSTGENSIYQVFYDHRGVLNAIVAKWDGDLWIADVTYKAAP